MSDYFIEVADITGLSVNEVRRRMHSGGVALTQDQAREFDERISRREWAAFELAAEEGDFSNALSRLSSSLVARGLVYLDAEYGIPDDELRDILREHWTRCDAPGDATEALLALFQRAGYVSDTDRTLTGELAIYRGTFGDDPNRGLSWTLEESKAQWFAFRGARGVPRDRSMQTVWRATVDASAILGYFVEREEAEAIVAPQTLEDVRLVQTPVEPRD
jgi:hypothetical protein